MKKRIVIFTLIFIEIISIFLTYKSFKNQNIIVYTEKYEKNNMFAIYVPDGLGGHILFEDNDNYDEEYVKELILNLELSNCKDINGNEVPNVLSLDDENNITVKIEKTVYCELYFDKSGLDNCNSFNSCCSQGFTDSDECMLFCENTNDERCQYLECVENPTLSSCCESPISNSCNYYCEQKGVSNGDYVCLASNSCKLEYSWESCCSENSRNSNDCNYYCESGDERCNYHNCIVNGFDWSSCCEGAENSSACEYCKKYGNCESPENLCTLNPSLSNCCDNDPSSEQCKVYCYASKDSDCCKKEGYRDYQTCCQNSLDSEVCIQYCDDQNDPLCYSSCSEYPSYSNCCASGNENSNQCISYCEDTLDYRCGHNIEEELTCHMWNGVYTCMDWNYYCNIYKCPSGFLQGDN